MSPLKVGVGNAQKRNGFEDVTVANGHEFCRFEEHREHARERARLCVANGIFFCFVLLSLSPKAVSLRQHTTTLRPLLPTIQH